MAEVEKLKAQIEMMIVCMKQLSDQVEKLMTAPAPALTPPPAPAPTSQPQPQTEPPDAWQRYKQAADNANAQPGAAAPPLSAPPLRPINPKDVEKPEKFDSTGDGWLEWSKAFTRFLDRNDAPNCRWSSLLKAIESLKGRPITAQDEVAWEAQLGLGNISDWKAQLEAYLGSYTKGRAREIVRHAGTAGALDAWRILADKGHSLRPMHQQALRSKAYAPRTNVPAKDLEMTIIRWENDVRLFEEACAPEVVSEQNRRMFLENMCPDRLRDHLSAQGPLRFPTGDSLRTEISDWIQKELERSTRNPKAAALETHWPDGAAEDDVVDPDEAECGVLGSTRSPHQPVPAA